MLAGMPPEPAPPEIVALAEERLRARRARDWAVADRLKAEIEAAGWKVVDAGTMWSVERAAPATVHDGERVRYGTAAAVPSRLDDEPVGRATVVIVADDATDAGADAAARTAGQVADHAPDGTQVVVVANGIAPDAAASLLALDATDPGAPGVVTEVVWTSGRLGRAAALNAGIRRAAAPVVILLDGRVEVGGDVVGPLVASLDDPAVAVAGPDGLVTSDLRHFVPAPRGAREVAAVAATALAFRRPDFVTHGPLDEGFREPELLDAWWSLVLRGGGDDGDGAPPRRAAQVPDVPVVAPEVGAVAGEDASREALRKNRYRLLKRFATHRELIVAAGT